MRYIVIFLISTSTVFSQEINIDSTQNRLKSYSEVSYELFMSPGYSHLWNINDKIVLGAGLHVGYAIYFIPEYSDFVLIKLFTRDFFSKNKFSSTNEKYDIGLYGSFSNQHQVFFYGIMSSYYFNLTKKLKLGVNLQIGEFINDDNENGMYFSLSPIAIYKFNTRK